MAFSDDNTECTEGKRGDCTPASKSHLVGSTINGAVIGAVVFGLAGAAISAMTGIDVPDGAIYGGAGGAVIGGGAGLMKGMSATRIQHQQVVAQRMQQRPGVPVNWHLEINEASTRISNERALQEQSAAQSALITEVAQEMIGI